MRTVQQRAFEAEINRAFDTNDREALATVILEIARVCVLSRVRRNQLHRTITVDDAVQVAAVYAFEGMKRFDRSRETPANAFIWRACLISLSTQSRSADRLFKRLEPLDSLL